MTICPYGSRDNEDCICADLALPKQEVKWEVMFRRGTGRWTFIIISKSTF